MFFVFVYYILPLLFCLLWYLNLKSNMIICSACNTELLSGDAFLECAVAECTKVYHYFCNNRQLTLEERTSWVCPECYAAGKSIYCNELPISVNSTPITNISARNKNQPVPLSPEDLPFHIGLEMQLLREQINVLTVQLADAMSTIGQFQFALSDCTKKVEMCNQKLSKLEQAPICSRCHSDPPGISTLPETINTTDRQLYSEPVASSSKAKQDIHTKCISEPPPPPRASSSEPNTDFTPAEMVAQTAASNLQASDAHEWTRVTKKSKYRRPVSTPAEMVTQTAASNLQASDAHEWTRVTNKSKYRRPVSIQGAAGPTVTSLRAVEARKHLHLWNMESTADEIRDYLRTLCGTDACTIDELTPKGNYKSFKIGVPVACYERCYSADVWPVNARIKAWINYRKSSPIQSIGQRVLAPQPFREQLTRRDKTA